MNRNLFLLISGFLVLQIQCLAQKDSLQTDTTNTIVTEKAMQLMLKSDSIHMADSINQIVLLKQMQDLKSYEKSKRRALEKELETLKQKDSLRKTALLLEVETLKKQAIGYPVIVHKDTLFSVFTKIGPISAKERAEIIKSRLLELYQTYLLNTDSLSITNSGQAIEIYFRDKIILTITELDELWFEQGKLNIAKQYKQKILTDIAAYKKDKSLTKTLKEIGLVLLVIIVQVFLIIGINKLFRKKINLFLWDKRGKWFKGISFRKYEFLNENQQASAVLFLAKLIRFATIILILYLSLPIIFSIFPLTQRLAEILFSYILSPLRSILSAFVAYIPKLITIVVILVITHYILKLFRFIASEIEAEKFSLPGFYPDWAKPTYNIIRLLVLVFMFIVIFPYLPGSDSVIFKSVSIFIGVVFSISSSSIIGNMMAGLVITYMRPFKIGDRIKIGEVIGNVVEKTPFVTRVRTPKKENITIPNANVLSQNVMNYSNSKLQGGLVIHTTVTIGYDVPWRKVHQALINAAKKTSNLNMDIAPFVLQTSLDDFYVSYQLNAHTFEPDKQPAIYSELHQNIQDGFNEAGIEILSPHYRAARDGNQTTIPEDYLPEDYKAPGFNLTIEKK
jgi:small-conductance mechanosensitive channel